MCVKSPILLLCSLFALCFFTFPVYSSDGEVTAGEPLRLGVLPYLSTNALIQRWRPFSDYLEHQLQRPVVILTAPDYARYIRRSEAGNYDLIFTAPHFAARANAQGLMQPFAKFTNRLQGDILVEKNSRFHQMEDLQGAIIATPDKLAVITMLGEMALSKHGLIPGRDTRMLYLPSHNAAILALLEGRAQAAIAVGGLYKRMPGNVGNRLRLLDSTREIAHAMFMLRADYPLAEAKKIRAVVKDFTEDDSASGEFFKNAGFGETLVPVTEQDVLELGPILPLLNERL